MNRRLIFASVGSLIGIFTILITFPLWSPLFIDNVVDEAFPELTEAQREQIRQMSSAQQDELVEMANENAEMANQTALAMLEPDTMMDEPMPNPVPSALRSGMFNEFDPIHKGTGTATIYELAEGVRVLRLEDLNVNNGPDLYVWLATVVPTSITEGLGDDIVDLGPLKGNIGNQNYDIPAEVDLTKYVAVVIYCRPFGVNFTVAELR